jgi:hypothetical protein
MIEGMHALSPPLPTARSRKISNVKPCPNWDLISRGGLSDQEFTDRFNMLRDVRPKMMAPHHRKLIPEHAWEEIVDYSILKAVTTWKGNGEGLCPLPHYAYRILRNTGIQYWHKNKEFLLDVLELDRNFTQD